MSKRKGKTSDVLADYSRPSQVNHCLQKPGMYIGSVEFMRMKQWVERKGIIKQKTGKFNPGLLHIFLELLSNVMDNVAVSRLEGVKVKEIRVNIAEDGTISIRNDGRHIPVKMYHPKATDDLKESMWLPQMIFSNFRGGSNFKKTKKGVGGTYGIGAKATNVFSTMFEVECYDPEEKKLYKQRWTDNMKDMGKPEIVDKERKSGYTKISYKADFKRFGCEGYSSDMLSLIKKYVYDCAMITSLPVKLNGEVIKVPKFVDYVKMYEPDNERIEFKSKDCEVVLVENNIEKEFYQVSFVNSIPTTDGGVHVDAWLEAILRPIVDEYNKKLGSKRRTSSKTTKTRAKKTKSLKLNLPDVKKYFSIFVKFHTDHPKFLGQQKSQLTGPVPETKVTKTALSKIKKLPGFVQRMNNHIKFKQMQRLAKGDGKKRSFVRIEGADDANEAGGTKSSKCTLILCEGHSAKNFAVSGISTIPNGRDYYGILPLKGKPKNTRNAKVEVIEANKEITELRKMLALQWGKDYSTEESRRSLRYGQVKILTDADLDGIHIQGLIINFFIDNFPSLLENGFISYMPTPIVKTTLRGNITWYYDENKFKKLKEKGLPSGMSVKYYKGLGTWKAEEVSDGWDKKNTEYEMDDEAIENADLAFNDNRGDDRKKWLSAHDPTVLFNMLSETMTVSEFINYCLRKFSIYSTARAIPHLMDGLKLSTRKILWVAFLIKLYKEMKVAIFGGHVSQRGYHHGEESLYGAIKGMAADYPGSNNISLFLPNGQFGSRLSGAKGAAAPRYIFTELSPLAKLLFRKEDEVLLDRVLDDEGKEIEPVCFMPIIPTLLVNGASGIGTGYSSTIPSYNPTDLLRWIRAWLNIQEGKEDVYPDLLPWYRGFEGKVEKKVEKKIEKVFVYGEYTQEGNEVRITNLPIGTWCENYKTKVEKWIEAKKVKKMRYNCDHDKIDFKLTLPSSSDALKPSIKTLGLKDTISMSNLVAFDMNGVPKRYSSIEDLFGEYCSVRLVYYAKRKKAMLKQMKSDLKYLKNKRRFLREVMKEENDPERLVIFRRKWDVVHAELEKRGYEKKEGTYLYLKRLNIGSFCEEDLVKLAKEIQAVKDTIATLKATTVYDLWRNDLEEFETAYTEYYKKWEENKKRGKTGGKTRRRRVKK